MRYRRVAGVAGSVCAVALAAASGCSSPSAKEELFDSVNSECDTVNERFTGDLAYGEGIGSDDLQKMLKRAALLKDLQKHVREQPPPESGRKDLDEWLDKLGTYADDTESMYDEFSNAQMGSDLALAMRTGIVQDAALATKAPAKRFGLDSCTHVAQWEKLG